MAGPWEKYKDQSDEPEENGPWNKYTGPDTSKPFGQRATAVLEGGGNALTLGLLPKLQAVYGASMEDPQADTDRMLRAKGVKVPESHWNEYGYQKQQFENLRDHYEKDDPEDYYAGELGAAVVPALAGGVGLIKSAPGVGKGLLNAAGNQTVQKIMQTGGPWAAAYGLYKNYQKSKE